MASKIETDIAVVGGGLAGGLAAIAFADAGFEVALIDAAAPATRLEESFDGRTTALAYGCARAYKRLGLWDDIAAHAEPIRDILVTDGETRSLRRDGATSPFHLHFDSRDLPDETPLGHIIENRRLRLAIDRGVRARPAIAVFAPTQREATDLGAERVALRLADGRHVAAALVVAADGRHSPLRAEAGIKVNAWRYRQTGIVVTVRHEKAHGGVAQEFFLPSGPFAILPMTDNRSSLVWTEREDAAPAFLALDDARFLKAVEARFGDYLGAIALDSPRSSYPLALHLSQSFIAPRLALVGDAAHAVHPIAGQGYNLGVKDVAALSEILAEARGLGLDIGHMAVLERYQRWRRFDSTMLALGMDVLNRLFSNDVAPLRHARRLGIAAVGAARPLRQVFMKQAGADLGTLPALMRPGV